MQEVKLKPPRWWWNQKKREFKEKYPNKSDTDIDRAIGRIWYHIYTPEKRKAVVEGKLVKKKPIVPGKVLEVTEKEDRVLVPLVPLMRSFTGHLIYTIAYDLLKLGYSLTEIRSHYRSLREVTRQEIIETIEKYGRAFLG